MKKNHFWLSLCLFFLAGTAIAQTQAPNPGFEDWPGEVTSSPKGWHSYDEAGGMFSNAASNKSGNPTALERVAGHRGKYACVIRCNKIMGVSANGALTTGRVYMGAMGASSSKNYCFTDRANGYACKFTGRPDSVYFWAKFKMKGDVYATAKAHLHTDCDFRDFVDIGQPSDIASAILFFNDKGNGEWHQYKQAFKAYASPQKAAADRIPMPTVSNWTRKPSYLLFCFSTNRYVMKGSKSDALYIDDIRMIYNKALSSIEVNGVELNDFHKETLEYTYYYNPVLTSGMLPNIDAQTESPRARVHIRQATLDNPVAVITVSHDDVDSGEAAPRIYRIRFISTEDTEQIHHLAIE